MLCSLTSTEIKPKEFTVSRTFTLINSLAALSTDEITEGYSKTQLGKLTMFVANVSAERLGYVFLSLCDLIEGYSYVSIEHEDLAQEPPVKDIYFITDVLSDEFLSIFSSYHRILLESPAITFAYASHLEEDEVYLGPYKTLRIFTSEPEKYENLLKHFELRRYRYLMTPSEVLEKEKDKAEKKSLVQQTITREEIDRMLKELEKYNIRFAKRNIIK